LQCRRQSPWQVRIDRCGLRAQDHSIRLSVTSEHQTRTQNTRMAADRVSDLLGPNEHPAYFGGLIGSPHPAADPSIRTSAGAEAREERRQIADCKPYHRMTRIECGHDHLTSLAVARDLDRDPLAQRLGQAR